MHFAKLNRPKPGASRGLARVAGPNLSPATQVIRVVDNHLIQSLATGLLIRYALQRMSKASFARLGM